MTAPEEEGRRAPGGRLASSVACPVSCRPVACAPRPGPCAWGPDGQPALGVLELSALAVVDALVAGPIIRRGGTER